MASKDWNNMLSGRLYHAQDSELAAARLRARRLVFRYNQSAPENESLRRELARELFGQMGEGCYLEPPLRCDYGSNTRQGLPTATTLAGMSFVTTLPAPITEFLPIRTPGAITA